MLGPSLFVILKLFIFGGVSCSVLQLLFCFFHRVLLLVCIFSLFLRSFDLVMYYQDGTDLEMNLNGSRYKAEDDDFDDMV